MSTKSILRDYQNPNIKVRNIISKYHISWTDLKNLLLKNNIKTRTHKFLLSRKKSGKTCKICNVALSYSNKKGYCQSCSLKKTLKEKGFTGRVTLNNGYISIKKPSHPNSSKGGSILEHRYIMSQFLKRPLKKKEVVHHINGIKDDNRLENLILFKNQKMHHSTQTNFICKFCGKNQENRRLKCLMQ